jgi:hypothetical protein
MLFFGLRGLVLMAILGLLILRIVFRFAKRSNTVSGPRWSPTSRNAFCIHCGAPLQGTGQFCGNCGVRRE